MHPDIEKLINIAKESGELTEKQKEIILRKAEKLGEDVDEVELILESTSKCSIVPNLDTHEVKRIRCNNCGAIIPSLAGFCPECGMPVDKESSGAKVIRNNIKSFSEKLEMILGKNDENVANSSSFFKQMVLSSNPNPVLIKEIQSFTVPFTVESLTQGFNYAISNYHSLESTGTSPEEAMAWHSKAKEFYWQIASMREKDKKTEKWLHDNEGLLKLSTAQAEANSLTRLFNTIRKFAIPLIVLVIIDIVIIIVAAISGSI